MYYEEAIRRIEKIDRLIRIKGTGSAAELAERLGVSRASVYEYLDLMKQRGAPIKYCQSRKTFYYDEEGRFETCFVPSKEVRHGRLNDVASLVPFLLVIPSWI